jgi:arylsulfatase A-like enzyme
MERKPVPRFARHIVTALLGGALFLPSISSAQSTDTPSDGPSVPFTDTFPKMVLKPRRSESSPPQFPKPVEAPKGAPNILIIITDDVGFGASSAFGGLISTPTFDELGHEGLRYNDFNTTGLCSPSRAALLTGRNHHSVSTGIIGEMSTGYPGYTAVMPNTAATIAKVLQYYNYSTAWFGKNHNTPSVDVTPAGPFRNWPNARGFDYFYGFMGGATNQFRPELYENTLPTERDLNDKSYDLERDLADHTIQWLRNHEMSAPTKPFFINYAPGAAHGPNQVPAEWMDKFKGRFDMGWDVMREKIFERQKQLGVIPPETKLTPRSPSIPAWDSLTPEDKQLYARLMEAYAGQLAYADAQIGRVIAELKRTGQFDNTLIFYIQGDNGATAEGTIFGTVNDVAPINGRIYTTDEMRKYADRIGVDAGFGSLIPAGFGWALNTPFRETKGIASYFGATRNGMVVTWPDGIKAKDQLRTQFHHIIDIVPTIYDAVGIKPPKAVDGVPQKPIEGVSMRYSFDAPKAPSDHHSQYFEMVANRAFYKDGWMASTQAVRPPGKLVGFDQDPETQKWELFNLNEDFSQNTDLSAKFPQKLEELKRDFDTAAQKYNVYPIDARASERIINPDRVDPMAGRSDFIFNGSPTRYYENAFPNMKNKSWEIEAHFTSTSADHGTLIAHGGHLGGWSLRLADGHPEFLYRTGPTDEELSRITAPTILGKGDHLLTVKFDYDGAPSGGGGLLTISENGKTIVQGKINRTVRFLFEEGASIGRDYGTSLARDYDIPDRFSGSIDQVKIHLKSKI